MKKIISILTIAVLLMSMTVTAFAFPGDERSWIEANNFSPSTFKAAKGPVTIDGEKDSTYTTPMIPVIGFSEYGGLSGDPGASGEAYAAWDDNNLYIHIEVEDNTKALGGGYTADSVELYLDYDQTADGKKVKWNKVSSSDTNATQYRIQRGGNSLDVAVGGNDLMNYVAEKSKIAVVENGNVGYSVEIAVPLKDESGAYMPVSSTIGFELQINDSADGANRISAAYIQGGIQYHAYEYAHLFDNLSLSGSESITWSTRTVTTAVDEGKLSYNTKPSSTATKPSSVASRTPSTVSSKPSSVSNKPSSVASKVSSAVSGKVSSAASEVSSVESTVSTLEETPAGTTDIKNDDTNTETQTDDTTNTIGAEDKGGLSTPIIIAIVAGGVLVLAAAAVAVILILKKKGANAEATAEEAPEETPEETPEENTEE